MHSVTVRRKESKPKSRKADGSRATQIWETADGDCTAPQSGFLVTGDSLDDVISYVPMNKKWEPDKARTQALKVARRIANNPTAKYLGARDVDLRKCGKIDSTEEMPGSIYGLWCRPLGATRGLGVNPKPFCRFKMARMVMQFNQLRFPNECRELAYHMVGLARRPDGTDTYECEVVAAIDRPMTPEQLKVLIGDDDAYCYNDGKIQERLKAMYPMGSDSKERGGAIMMNFTKSHQQRSEWGEFDQHARLWCLTIHIDRLLSTHAPDHPLLSFIQKMHADAELTASGMPTIADLLKIESEWLALSPEERIKLSGGWCDLGEFLPVEFIRELEEGPAVVPMCEIVAHDFPIPIHIDFKTCESTNYVHVCIVHGTTQAEALAQLDKIRDQVANNWQNVITESREESLRVRS
jgi:hypothetical protein